MTAPASLTAPVGAQIRHWRARRRLSQLELALEADVSTRHLSCLETGRAAPSREMILRLANRLDMPLRERNRLLTAAGFAPMYPARPVSRQLRWRVETSASSASSSWLRRRRARQ